MLYEVFSWHRIIVTLLSIIALKRFYSGVEQTWADRTGDIYHPLSFIYNKRTTKKLFFSSKLSSGADQQPTEQDCGFSGNLLHLNLFDCKCSVVCRSVVTYNPYIQLKENCFKWTKDTVFCLKVLTDIKISGTEKIASSLFISLTTAFLSLFNWFYTDFIKPHIVATQKDHLKSEKRILL